MDENGNAQVWDNYYPFGMQMPGTSPQMNQTGSADTRYKLRHPYKWK